MVEQSDPARMDWIRDRYPDSGVAGYDVTGWDDSVWILHRMYEDVGSTDETTWADAGKHQIPISQDEPLIVGQKNLDEVGITTGITLGDREEPVAAGWERLAWEELARRLGVTFSDVAGPPCDRWFPYESWPMRIEPAAEGSLDAADLGDLLDVLARHSIVSLDTPCLCYFAPLVWANYDTVDLRAATLGEVLDICEAEQQSPSNFWPEDRSWFVYTNWDLEGTRVSGTRALVDDLIDDSRLETIRGTW